MIYISKQNIYINPLHIESIEVTDSMDINMYSQWNVVIYTGRGSKYTYYSGSYGEAYKARDALIGKINSYLNGLLGLKK